MKHREYSPAERELIERLYGQGKSYATIVDKVNEQFSWWRTVKQLQNIIAKWKHGDNPYPLRKTVIMLQNEKMAMDGTGLDVHGNLINLRKRVKYEDCFVGRN